ncbi:serine/threonine-protein kinase [Thalassotalea sp. G20_0]|nr:serine/threonine-protein kinase [Thalassotalea sp. G20_0]
MIGLVDSRSATETTSAGDDMLRISLLTESGIASLNTVATKAQPLPARDIARMMKGVLAGVKHLHDHRITHSDLKPRNVVLMPDMTTKLIDFGSAREFGDDVEQLDCRDMGTPGYVAPEIDNSDGAEAQLATFEELRKADYWAVGCILYELVTGGPLFDEQPEPDGYEDMSAQVNKRIIAMMPEEWNTNDVQAVQECLNELLKTAPEQRQVIRLETFIENLGNNG